MRLEKLFLLLACLTTSSLLAAPPVTVSQNADSFTLDNGIVTARVSKRTGNLTSLTYKHLQMLDAGRGPTVGGYWSHNTARGERTDRITIDPAANGGERGEVSVKGVSHGRPMGSGPGGSVVADIEIRYAVARGDSAVYTYCVFSHPTNYPATSVGEARFCAKLNDSLFDWLTVDSNRNLRVITAYDWDHGSVMNFKEARRMNTGIYKGQVEHKYDYSANQFDTRAWGWSSSDRHVGIWFINPSMEYLSGGPTKVELSAHRDATFGHDLNAPAPPCLLNYWRSSHYGGSICNIAKGEAWTKVIGPFLIYCNAGPTHDAMWRGALKRSKREARSWPYNWVEGVDYPHRDQRGTVKGQLVLRDPQAPHLKMRHLLVGLTAPDYLAPPVRWRFRGFGRRGFGRGGTNRTNRVQRNRQSRRSRGDGSDPGTSGEQATNESLVAHAEAGTDTNEQSSETNSESPQSRRSSNRRGRFRRFGGFGFFHFGPRQVTWQNDAKHYEFWGRGDDKGQFTIPNVRPGRYTLHAITDGVLGEFAVSNVTVRPGQTLNLAKRPGVRSVMANNSGRSAFRTGPPPSFSRATIIATGDGISNTRSCFRTM